MQIGYTYFSSFVYLLFDCLIYVFLFVEQFRHYIVFFTRRTDKQIKTETKYMKYKGENSSKNGFYIINVTLAFSTHSTAPFEIQRP
jgi:hypothetical protein